MKPMLSCSSWSPPSGPPGARMMDRLVSQCPAGLGPTCMLTAWSPACGSTGSDRTTEVRSGGRTLKLALEGGHWHLSLLPMFLCGWTGRGDSLCYTIHPITIVCLIETQTASPTPMLEDLHICELK